MSKKTVRRPQAPKRRNFVKKHMDIFQKPKTHRDRSKYDRYEDFLKDQLDSYVDDLEDDETVDARKEEFKAKLKGEEYDPDLRKEWEDWLDRGADDEFFGFGDDLDDDDSIDFTYNGYDDYDY